MKSVTLGADIRKRRRALGLSQATLARALQINPNSLSRWETGSLGCRHSNLVLLYLEILAQRQAQGLGGKVDAALAPEV